MPKEFESKKGVEVDVAPEPRKHGDNGEVTRNVAYTRQAWVQLKCEAKMQELGRDYLTSEEASEIHREWNSLYA